MLGGFTAADVTALAMGADVVLQVNGGGNITVTDGVTVVNDVLFA